MPSHTGRIIYVCERPGRDRCLRVLGAKRYLQEAAHMLEATEITLDNLAL